MWLERYQEDECALNVLAEERAKRSLNGVNENDIKREEVYSSDSNCDFKVNVFTLKRQVVTGNCR
jgi:hypothetical protein